MRRPALILGVAGLALLAALAANLTFGASAISPAEIVRALVRFDEASYDHYIVLYQRLPRAAIAAFVGAVMACGGGVLQGLTRNPLAAPSILGINSGATLFVVAGVSFFGLSAGFQGIAAIAGGLFGFASCIVVARLAGLSDDPRGLSLILSGAIVSMLYVSIANALLLASPARRTDFMSWVTGNINHVYADRLADFWWIGAVSLAALMVLARPLTLITLGAEKAASAGVNVTAVTRLAVAAVVVSASSAVAVCGPIGFVGLIVPHMVRPLAGETFRLALPVNALAGATVCLLADLAARTTFAPHVLHTGLMMDLAGGIVFALLVRRFYLVPFSRSAAS